MDAHGTIEENGTLIYQVKNWYQSLPASETGIKNSKHFFRELLNNSKWHQNEHHRFGNKEPRLSFATGEARDQRGKKIVHKYGDVSIEMEPWTDSEKPELQRIRELRDVIEEQTGVFHDAALVQRYRNGMDYNKAHFDSGLQKSQSRYFDLEPTEIVYCLSLGARRKFVFHRNDDGAKFEYWLDNGDVLVMEGLCQDQFTHEVPKVTARKTPDDKAGSAVGERISITWRLLGYWNLRKETA